jgi:hypothetical protein
MAQTCKRKTPMRLEKHSLVNDLFYPLGAWSYGRNGPAQERGR